jgi:four helix bundle protein
MRDHKSLFAWQRARRVALGVLHLSKSHWQPRASALFAQLQRSSLSVQLNIAEGHALKTPSRFRYHLTVALGSAVETVELLELGIEADVFPASTGRELLETAIESRALLFGLLKRYPRLKTKQQTAGE